MPTLRPLLSLFLLSCLCSQLSGLDARIEVSQYQKQHWQMEEGLPHNYVFTIQTAPDGYLLVGTDEGLARFDGTHFLPYDLIPQLDLSKSWILSMIVAKDRSIWTGAFDGGLFHWRDGKVLEHLQEGSSIFDILQDTGGNIWASTREGVIRSAKNGSFARVSALQRPPDTAWNVLALDSAGAVWIVTSDGLYRANAGKVERVATSDAVHGQLLSVHCEPGEVLIGTSLGLYTLDLHKGQAILKPRAAGCGPVVAIVRDRDANIWVGTWGHGLYRVNSQGIQNWSTRDAFPDDFVRQLHLDASGNLWIGLRGGGLSRWKDPALVPFGAREGLRGEYASTAANDRAGHLWLGTWRGGLYQFHDEKLVNQPIPVSPLFFTIRTMAFDYAGRVWIGNWEGLFVLEGNSFKHFAGTETPYHHISVILFDRQRRLWIATSDDGIFLFASGIPGATPAPVHLEPHREITSLVEANDGSIWFGSSSGAGWIDEAKIDAVHELQETRKQAFTGLSIDQQGAVWGCTLSGALWKLTPNGSRVLDKKSGLPGFPLYLALDDNRGALWVSSSRGILRLEKSSIDGALQDPTKQVDFQLFDREDGMRTIECHRISQPAGVRDQKGRLWFPTSKGFIRIDPARLQLPYRVPPMRIEKVIWDEKASVPGELLKLPPGHHSVEFDYTALEFSSPEKLRFRYRMDGLEREWNFATGERVARYNHLPPGQYSFQVAAAIADGPWSNGLSMEVEQAPEFYQTRLFQIFFALALLAVGFLILRWQMQLFRQRYFAVAAERNRIAMEWHDTLLAGFSAISLQIEAAMYEVSNAGRAREILSVTRAMVHHYRAEARRVIWDLHEDNANPGSLQLAINKVVSEAARNREIGCELNVIGAAIDVSRELEHNLLRVCQEAVSNAIQHASPNHIRVKLQYEMSALTLRIEDDGTGFEPASLNGLKNGHFGLTIMHERIQRIGGSLVLDSQPGTGTVIEATVPITWKIQKHNTNAN